MRKTKKKTSFSVLERQRKIQSLRETIDIQLELIETLQEENIRLSKENETLKSK